MDLKRLYEQTLLLIKDVIFPKHCFGCDAEGKFVCDDCYRTLDISGVFCCPVCHAPSDRGQACTPCEGQMCIDRHLSITPYTEDGLIGDMMHSFKYHYAQDVRDVFDTMIRDFFIQNTVEVDVIIPVPLHRRRFVERGFNQSQIIAVSLARVLDTPIVADNLMRARYTIQQAKLKREERLKNLAEAFELKNSQDLVGKKVLLVDDVFTTGSTVNECAKVLKKFGVASVTSFSIARG